MTRRTLSAVSLDIPGSHLAMNSSSEIGGYSTLNRPDSSDSSQLSSDQLPIKNAAIRKNVILLFNLIDTNHFCGRRPLRFEISASLRLCVRLLLTTWKAMRKKIRAQSDRGAEVPRRQIKIRFHWRLITSIGSRQAIAVIASITPETAHPPSNNTPNTGTRANDQIFGTITSAIKNWIITE